MTGNYSSHLACGTHDRMKAEAVRVARVLANIGHGHMCLAGLAYRSRTEKAPPKMRRVYVIRGNAMPRRYW